MSAPGPDVDLGEFPDWLWDRWEDGPEPSEPNGPEPVDLRHPSRHDDEEAPY